MLGGFKGIPHWREGIYKYVFLILESGALENPKCQQKGYLWCLLPVRTLQVLPSAPLGFFLWLLWFLSAVLRCSCNRFVWSSEENKSFFLWCGESHVRDIYKEPSGWQCTTATCSHSLCLTGAHPAPETSAQSLRKPGRNREA